MSEKRNINLTIADIPLNLNISAADEEIIRKAAKEINERVLKYKTGNTEPEPFYFCFFFNREIQCVIKIVKTVIDALHEKNAPNIKMRRRVLP